MTNEQILKKAIEKAVENGWKPKFIPDYKNLTVAGEFLLSSSGIILTGINTIIFDHQFAKAFWDGEVMYCGDCLTVIKEWSDKCDAPNCKRESLYKQKSWQYHLKQMVLEEYPIKYLERFID